MSGKTNITSFLISFSIIVLTIFVLIPHLNIESVNKKLSDYQWIIGLFSAVAIVLWAIYSYQNWTFKKEEKSSNQIQIEYLNEIKDINRQMKESGEKDNIQDQKINDNTHEIILLKIDVEELKKKRPARKRNNA